MTTRQIPAIRNVDPAVAKILEPMRAALLELTSGTTRAVRYTDLDRGSFQVVNNVLKPIVVPKAEPEITRRLEALEAAQTDISTLADELLGEARFGKLLASNLYDAKVIKANVNGHVAGLAVAVYDSGEHITSDFIVQADRFSVVFPSPPWAPNQGYAQGQYVTPTAEHGATGFIYECTTAGVSGATEPAWPAEEGQTVTDGTAVWTCRSIDERVPFVVGNIDGTPGVGIDGDLIVDGTILARHIKAQAITADKIAAGAIEAEHLATNLLLTSHIQIAPPGVIHSGQLDYDVGVGFWIGNDGVTPKLSIGNSGGNKITWDGSTLTVIGNVSGALDAGSIVGTLPSSLFDISALGWTIDATFSAVDGDTVAWTAGTLYTAAGASYAIEAGDTGDMTERTYIYFDVNVSTTALQVTTDPGSAVGPGRVMIAVAENDSPLAFFQVFGGSGSFGATVPDIPSYGPLANGDFETGSTDGWEADASWSVVSGSIVTGTHVARIATSTTGLRSLPFTAGQGQRFLVTCVAQRDETSLPDGNLRLELRWLSDPDTAPFYSSNVVEANASVSGPQFLRLVVEVPAGKVGAKVVARKITGSSGHWLVDDFFVTPMLRDADIGKINLSTQVDGILTAAFAEAGLINANVWINADGTLTGAGGGQVQLNALPGAIDLATQVSGLLTEQFAAAGLINENITINADGTLSGAGGGQVSISSLPGLLDLGTQVTGKLQAAFAAAGLINENITINADGTLSGAGGGQVQLPQLPGAISAGQIAANTITGEMIAALTVTAANIAAATITGEKIAAQTIVGANIAGATITGAKIAGETIVGANIAGGTITGDKIGANQIAAVNIAALAITSAHIAANQITSSHIAADAIQGQHIDGQVITGAHIAAGTITGSHIAVSTITGSHIAGNTITGSHIAGNTITGNKIAAGAITGNHIAANSITANHIQSGQITSGLLAASLVYAGNLQIETGGAIRSGQSTFDSGVGWFLGMPGGVPMFSIGNSAGNKITWNGSTLKIVGDLNFPNRFVALDDPAAEIGSNGAIRVSNDNNTDWVTAHQFMVFGTGTVTVRVRVSATWDVEVQPPQVRVLRNGTTVVGEPRDFGSGAGIEQAWAIPVSSVEDTFQVQLRSGIQLLPGQFNPGLLFWTSVRARLTHATFF